jgi:hypothetical protein
MQWIMQYDFWASIQRMDSLPLKMQADSLIVAIKIFMSLKLTDDWKANLKEIRNRFRNHLVKQINLTFERFKFNQIMSGMPGTKMLIRGFGRKFDC